MVMRAVVFAACAAVARAGAGGLRSAQADAQDADTAKLARLLTEDIYSYDYGDETAYPSMLPTPTPTELIEVTTEIATTIDLGDDVTVDTLLDDPDMAEAIIGDPRRLDDSSGVSFTTEITEIIDLDDDTDVATVSEDAFAAVQDAVVAAIEDGSFSTNLAAAIATTSSTYTELDDVVIDDDVLLAEAEKASYALVVSTPVPIPAPTASPVSEDCLWCCTRRNRELLFGTSTVDDYDCDACSCYREDS
ncbi:hypothetical protein JL720_6648 [Aureococcus anophagefferens]|nr:hypothetical protein JL720_6648 [Aureococcus anophagefferens]